MFKDVLKVINRNFKVGMKFNRTTLEVSFPNGSMIYLMGMDMGPEEMEKALGQKYRLCVIDECGSWRQDQEHLVHSILEPACADLEGTIVMTGSPVRETRSYFFRITSKPGNVKGWSCHSWTWQDNPHVVYQMQKQVDRIVANNPRIVETAPYKQMYLGLWVVDPGSLVYRFNRERDCASALPTDFEFNYLLGLDLGFDNPTSIGIVAYSPNCPVMYVVEVIKRKGLDITAVADLLKFYQQKYKPIKYIVDGASRQAVEELRVRHHFPLEPADKMGKADIIEIMNADFVMEKIKLLPAAECLASEYEELVWDSTSKKREEHPGYENDACDSVLYPWRYCYHFLSEPIEPKLERGGRSEVERWWEEQARIGQSKAGADFAMRDFGKDFGFH